MKNNAHIQGILSGLASALLLGFAPILGKLALNNAVSPLFIVSFRTVGASLLLFIILLVFKRNFFYIYPVGLVGCILAGVINGLGSILYYSALARLNTGIGQLLYSYYPLFVAFWLFLDRHPIRKITIIRLLVSLPGVLLLFLGNASGSIDWLGVVLMLGAAILYALHMIINQRILYEVPAPTVTFYTLLSMTLVVVSAFAAFDRQLPQQDISWMPVIAMAVILFLSRLTLFMGVKKLGGLQTAVLGLGELLTTVVISQVLFKYEKLSYIQWLGAGLIFISVFLVGFDKPTDKKSPRKGILSWLNPVQVNPADIDWDA